MRRGSVTRTFTTAACLLTLILLPASISAENVAFPVTFHGKIDSHVSFNDYFWESDEAGVDHRSNVHVRYADLKIIIEPHENVEGLIFIRHEHKFVRTTSNPNASGTIRGGFAPYAPPEDAWPLPPCHRKILYLVDGNLVKTGVEVGPEAIKTIEAIKIEVIKPDSD